MKKSNILIALFAVVAAASVAGAQGMRVDFDSSGSDLSFEKIKASAEDIRVTPVTKGVIDPFDGENPGELNHFKKGRRCVGNSCQDGYPGESCNIHTCGKAAAESRARSKENKEVKSLGETLNQLDPQAQQRFYSSLRFSNGFLIEAYTKDIRDAAGEQGVKGIMRHFLPEQRMTREGCRPGDADCTEDSYVDDARCNGHHTCVPANGWTCTEAC